MKGIEAKAKNIISMNPPISDKRLTIFSASYEYSYISLSIKIQPPYNI